MGGDSLKQKVIEDIALLHYVGVRVLLVHGGGPEINQMLSRLGIESKFQDGLRVTDEKTMEVVEMILTGKVQKDLVSRLSKAGARAVGLCGKDGDLMRAQKVQKEGKDWGLTGEITQVNPALLIALLEQNYLPVISSIAPDESATSYNINADNVASEIAVSMNAEKLIFLTDTPGILKDPKDHASVIKKIKTSEAEGLIEDGTITGGMIPKLRGSVNCIEKGVGSVHILNGTQEHVLLLEIFTESGIGTMISK